MHVLGLREGGHPKLSGRSTVNRAKEKDAREKHHKLIVIDIGTLPYEIIFVVDKPYMITATIDVVDGLADGVVGKLSHVELSNQNRVLQEMVPINRKSATAPLNRNRSIHAKRNNFSLKPASSLTVQKSKGGTLDEIVYKYSKAHSQPLVYVALSRVTAQELHIATTDVRINVFTTEDETKKPCFHYEKSLPGFLLFILLQLIKL
ncbi:uncharacterized protein TNCV_1401971 [Trichonephila clavipes]|nr:uncharacterized protein TNCV_1401971 [Trichonephila clavipes]